MRAKRKAANKTMRARWEAGRAKRRAEALADWSARLLKPKETK